MAGGRIQLLVVAGLRPWLLAGCQPETTLSAPPGGPPSMAAYFCKATRENASGRSASKTVSYNETAVGSRLPAAFAIFL